MEYEYIVTTGPIDLLIVSTNPRMVWIVITYA